MSGLAGVLNSRHMTQRTKNALTLAACAALLWSLPAAAQDAPATMPATPPADQPADQAPAAADLPDAKAVMEKYIEATGGRAAYEAIESQKLTGQILLPMGIKADLTAVTRGDPLGLYMNVVVPDVENQAVGFDGQTLWSTSIMQGPQIIDGPQKQAMIREVDPSSVLDYAQDYPTLEVVGEQEAQGQPAVVVRTVDAAGNEATRYFAKDGGLLLKIEGVQQSPMGEIPVVTTFADYQKFGEITVPTRQTMTQMGQEQTILIEDVQYNVEVDASKFQPPAEVKEIMAEEPAAPATMPAE